MDIGALFTDVPEIEIVGVAVIASLNEAVIVTTSVLPSRLSLSLSPRVAVGSVASTVIVILSVPPKAFPARSVHVTVTV